jgi:hypothetical protein
MMGAPYIAMTKPAMLAVRADHVSLRNMNTSRRNPRCDDQSHTAATAIQLMTM